MSDVRGTLRSELTNGMGCAVDYTIETNDDEGYIDLDFQGRLAHLFIHLGSDGRLTLLVKQGKGGETEGDLEDMVPEIVFLPLPAAAEAMRNAEEE